MVKDGERFTRIVNDEFENFRLNNFSHAQTVTCVLLDVYEVIAAEHEIIIFFLF